MKIEQSLIVGIDAGGTKSTLYAAKEGDPSPLLLNGPPAQYQKIGSKKTAGIIAALVQKAHDSRPDQNVVSVCAGIAGAGRLSEQKAVKTWLLRIMGNEAPEIIHVVDDASIALEAALDDKSGMMVSVGTGSMALARNEVGMVFRVGGWGHLLGDEGSGYAVGLDGLRLVASAFDGGPPTCLQALLSDKLGITDPEDLIRRVYRENWPIQQIAPLVLEACNNNESDAKLIIERQTTALAMRVYWLSKRAAPVARRLFITGGLSKNNYYRSHLESAVSELLPSWHYLELPHDPVTGAWRIALRRWRQI